MVKEDRACLTVETENQHVISDAELDEIIARVFHGADPESVGKIRYAIGYIRVLMIGFLRGLKIGLLEELQRGMSEHEVSQERKKQIKKARKSAGQDLYIISGPSGCGKDTVIGELLNRIENAACATSCTTRSPRRKKNGEMEKDGVDYYFIDRESFERKEEKGDFLESAEVHGELYGTPLADLEWLRLHSRNPIILNIDPEGAMQAKQRFRAATTIFLLPPGVAELRRRLEERNSETEESIARRMADAAEQIAYACQCDYVVVNDTIGCTVQCIQNIIEAHRHQSSRQGELIESILEDFESAAE